MDQQDEIVSQLLKIPEEAFFSPITDAARMDLESRLTDTEFDGLAMRTPVNVQLGQRDELPLLLAHRRNMMRAWQVPCVRNMFLVGSRIGDEKVLTRWMYGPEFPGRPIFNDEPEPEPDEFERQAIVSGVERFDARRVLELPWQPGVWRFTAVVHDWVSNTVEVELIGDKQPQPPQVPEVNPPFNPTGATPTYLKTAESPSAPEQGVNLEIEPTDKGRILVRGALATPIAKHQIVKWPMKHDYAENPQRVAAVVPVSVLLLRFDLEEPFLFNWAVPVYSEGEVQAGDRLEGFFTIDPLAGIEGELPGGEYVAYGVLGGTLYGPVRFSLERTPMEEEEAD